MLPRLAFIVLPALAGVIATPVSLQRRISIDKSAHCGQWDTVTAGPYTLFLDLWGASGATSGTQCSNLMGLTGNTIAWKTTWTWVGGNGVKSFSNIQLDQGVNQQLSAITSIPVSGCCHESFPLLIVRTSLRTDSMGLDADDYRHCRRGRRVRHVHLQHRWRLKCQ